MHRFNLPILFCIGLTAIVIGLAPKFVLAKLLEGKVEHSESLDPVEADLRPGNQFRQGNAIANSAFVRNRWFRVPNWLAGTWRYENRTTTYEFNYSTSQASYNKKPAIDIAIRSFGHQEDSHSNIWQFDETPYTVQSEGDDAIAYTLRTECVPISTNPEHIDNLSNFSIRILANQIRVDKISHQIVTNTSIESLQTFSLEKPGQVRLDYSEKFFNLDGQPTLLREGHVIQRCVNAFTPIDSLQGQDLKKLFNEFQENLAQAKL